MSDLIKKFKDWRPNMSAQDRVEALKVIEEQVEATMQGAQEAAQNIAAALTEAYRDAWTNILEKRRIDLTELEEVKRILSN